MKLNRKVGIVRALRYPDQKESLTMNEKQNREKQITRTSIVGIAANVCLVIFKAVVGFLSGSIAIMLDAVNNLTDAVSSVVTIAGVKLAKKKPTDDHPFGYGRIEYFSAVIISCIIIATGATSLVESVKKIIHPETPEYSTVTLIIVVAAIATKFFLGRYVKKQGEKYNSEALIASGSDAGFDAVISAATLVCAVVMLVFSVNLDGIVGAVIACFICKAGIEMLLSSVGSVMGARPDGELTIGIKNLVKSIPGVHGAYDLVLNDYGPNFAIGSIHVEVDDTLTAKELHKLTKRIQNAVLTKFSVSLTVGFYAHNTTDDRKEAMEEEIREMVLSHEGAIGMHAFYADEEQMQMSFDITIDFKVRNRAEFTRKIVSSVRDAYPGYTVAINLDANYSD